MFYQISSVVFLVLLASSLHLFKRAGISSTGRVLVVVAFAIQLLLFGGFVVSDYFTAEGLDESVIYHLRYGLGGAGFSEFKWLFFLSAIYVTATAVLSYVVFRFLDKRKSSNAGLPPAEFAPCALKSFASLALVASVGFNPLAQNIYALWQSYSADKFALTWMQNYSAPVIPEILTPKNIVYIYMEGLERTYFDEALFPGLVPNLSKLESDALSFTDIAQVYQSGWTIAGMVASQCGIPMFTPAQGNTMGRYDKFLPGAVCLGDILEQNGYRLSYMGGADKKFAGKGKFYESHGFQSVQGKAELADSLADPTYLNGWGLYDDALLERVTKRLSALSEEDGPFAVFALTLDTHPPDGHVSRSCRDIAYRDGKNSMLNAVACSDRLVAQFVEKIRSSPYADNTLIVVSSDHLSMRNSASEQLGRGDRKNLFFVIDPSASKSRKITRMGTMLDVAPTLLSLLGVDSDGLGFGRSLFDDRPTLREYAPHDYNDILRSAGRVLRADLWSYPTLGDAVVVDSRQQKIVIDDRHIEFPALLLVNQKAQIEDIKFRYLSEDVDAVHLDTLVNGLDPSQAYLWVDSCRLQLAQDFGSAERGKVMPRSWCATYGRGEIVTTKVLALESGEEIPTDRILSLQ